MKVPTNSTVARSLVLATAVAVTAACSDSSNSGSAKNPCVGEEVAVERLFLQQLTDSSVIIKWRGDAQAACIGTEQGKLNQYVEATSTEGDHREAVFTGLAAQTTYHYSVGGAGEAPAGQYFTTAPAPGELPDDGNTRIWLIGDSGTGGDDGQASYGGLAAAVRDGMTAYVDKDGEPLDLFVMLGDNAYNLGTDLNFQQAVFETYPVQLGQLSLWPTVGNHEMGANQTSADPEDWYANPNDEPQTMPYLDIFTLPAAGEAGGVASGSELYYSFDYANVHVVVLDSQISAREDSQLEAMRDWLIDDLSSNDSDWTIVAFHHPPYSKGANHDSDELVLYVLDFPQQIFREEFVPIFDEYGVDLVYNGHSHSYERSYYLHNHTGKSDTFSPAEHAELVDGDPDRPASGRGSEAYEQLSPTSGGVDDRVVYTVAGSSGKADKNSGLTKPDAWLRHAAHVKQPADTETPVRRGLAVTGSVIVDAGESKLTASFIDADGNVLDRFSINR